MKKIYLLGYSDMECFNVVSSYESKETAEYLASEINHALPDIQSIAAIKDRVSSFFQMENPYPYDANDEELEAYHQKSDKNSKETLQIILDVFGKRYVNEHLLSLVPIERVYGWTYMSFSVQEVDYHGN